MRLLFDLSPADEAAFEDARGADEKVLYCLPFDCRHDKRVDGRMVFTDKAIYKVIDAEVEARWDFSELSDFSVEVLYGCGAFFAKVNGHTTRLCRFISGRNLTRYSVIVEACNRMLPGTLKVSKEGLKKGLDAAYAAMEKIELPFIYANLHKSADGSEPEHQTMDARAMTLMVKGMSIAGQAQRADSSEQAQSTLA